MTQDQSQDQDQDQDQGNEPELDFTAFSRELELDKLPLEEREAVFADTLEALNLRVATRIMSGMSEEEKQHLRTIADVDPENMFQILLGNVPKEQLSQMFQEEIDVLKEEMKETIAKEGQSQE